MSGTGLCEPLFFFCFTFTFFSQIFIWYWRLHFKYSFMTPFVQYTEVNVSTLGTNKIPSKWSRKDVLTSVLWPNMTNCYDRLSSYHFKSLSWGDMAEILLMLVLNANQSIKVVNLHMCAKEGSFYKIQNWLFTK